ncbi:hypothetical protein [Nocardiopsis halotolerans]|uniref:hypothetical protein n=1 Tax=Nocardiopsis halotolerans TaxID=124252 RepID=UPI0003450591|nr:hypothetical protein [Nocardiopsis halotolerans]
MVETVTHRVEAGGSDTPRHHGEGSEAVYWTARDPLLRTEALLRAEGAFGTPEEADGVPASSDAGAEGVASLVRGHTAAGDQRRPLSTAT